MQQDDVIYIPRLEIFEIELEVSTLDYYYDLIEQQIRNKSAYEKMKLHKEVKNLTQEEYGERYIEFEAVDKLVNAVLPRLFRGPFLLMLYSVYESTVNKIAYLIQKKKDIEISFSDFSKNERGNFLDKAKKYFGKQLDFALCPDSRAWDRIKMLTELRHAIAHANGRIEMLKDDKKKEKISNWITQNIGILEMDNYIVFEERFLRDTYKLVRASIVDFVKRCEELDSGTAYIPTIPDKWND